MLLVATVTIAPPRSPHAQQKTMSVIGYLSLRSPPANLGEVPVHRGMSEMGFVEGQNIVSE